MSLPSQEDFDFAFLDILQSWVDIRFVDEYGYESKIPSSRFKLLDNFELLFDIDLNDRYPHFYASLQIFERLQDIFGITYGEVQFLMKNQIEERFKIYVIPTIP